MRPEVWYIPYATSSHEKTGDMINVLQFEEGDLVENKRNAEEDEYITASIDELSTCNDSSEGSISTHALEDIQDGSQIHPDMNARYARLKTRDNIRQAQSE